MLSCGWHLDVNSTLSDEHDIVVGHIGLDWDECGRMVHLAQASRPTDTLFTSLYASLEDSCVETNVLWWLLIAAFHVSQACANINACLRRPISSRDADIPKFSTRGLTYV